MWYIDFWSVSMIVVSSVLCIAFFLHLWDRSGRELVDSNLRDEEEKYFSGNYYVARKSFRDKAREANAELFSYSLNISDMDLTIDFAVLRQSKTKAFLHISGTHGVEGFAGSAIQNALLERAKRSTLVDSNPTIVFVHALNPYGYAQLRRFNEHNVDLNRNYLSREEFDTATKKDPNEYGYMNIDYLLNPKKFPSLEYNFWLNAFVLLMSTKYDSLKRSIVSGNYHYPKSVYFGGFQKEASINILEKFLKTEMDLKEIQKFCVIDVHTGLGPMGYDSLLLASASDENLAMQVFKDENDRQRLYMGQKRNLGAFTGYEHAIGYITAGVAALLQKNSTGLYLTQEFGTVNSIFVLKATIEENILYHHFPYLRLPYAERLRDVFYLHASIIWKKCVISRGLAVFDQLYGALR